MEGRSKSRFPEKCKNCIRGRFPSQFWDNFEILLAPKIHLLSKRKGPGNQSKQKEPTKSQIAPVADNGQAGWLPESPPSRTRFFKQETTVWAIVGHCSGFVAKKNLSRCNKSEMVAENSKVRSSWWGCYQKLIKTCWKRCSDYWNKCYYSESMKLLKKWQQVLERRHSAGDLTRPGQRPGELQRLTPWY